MFHQTRGDTDGDGLIDDGIVDDINQYGIGVVQFARQLRERMSDNFVIQGDGALGPGGRRSQRAWQLLNGIESEGWPNLSDWEFEDWSGGMNRHFFWRENARQPVFNYVNHKWDQPVPGKPGVRSHPEVPFARHRLALAACQFFDAVTCFSFAPPNQRDGRMGVWDELVCGTDEKVAWLGQPEGPATRLALANADQLTGTGQGDHLAERISGAVTLQTVPEGVRITPRAADATELRFTIQSIPTAGPDLYVDLTMKAEPRSAYPTEMARFVTVGVAGGEVNLLDGEPLQTGIKLRGSSAEIPLDRSSGAFVQLSEREIAGETLPAIVAHPPYRERTGYTFWVQEVDVPPHGELRFAVGMGPLSPQRSDGVWFQVYGAEVRGGAAGEYQQLFSTSTNQHRWTRRTVPLQAHAGQRLRLKFVADCGPQNNATTDHAHWGDVKLVQADLPEDQITRPKRYMTWANEHFFRSGFYYQQIRSAEVNLSFVVEGPESVIIQSLAAYARPDAICRVFQHGIVLANPSRRAYTFDLDQLSPGRKYRRIQATTRQDTRVNDGQPASGRITLEERDAVFLVRVK